MAAREEAETRALGLFVGIGLDETVAKNAAKNVKSRTALVDVIEAAGAVEGCSKQRGNLLYNMATKYPTNALAHRQLLLDYITADKIKTTAQLDGALEYVKKVGSETVDTVALDASAGVGVTVSPEQIEAAVSETIAKERSKLLEDRYHFNTNALVGSILKTLKWVDGAALRAEMEKQVVALLGPKTAEDEKPREQAPKKAKPPKADVTPGVAAAPVETVTACDDPYSHLPQPADNKLVHTSVKFSDGSVMHIANTPQQLADHLARTEGRVRTRFPPEPNGYLHIGHAKAMNVSFGMAQQYDGVCYLRYDDTNPDAEKLEYIEHIVDIVSWMGWKPWKTTFSSQYFQQLYEYAVQMIKTGHAYVCHQTKDEIEASREKREPSPFRDRPIEESLALFEDMRRGLIDEGAATLRMKMDHKNDNYNMFDLIAYRVKFTEHPKAGAGWCIYPSYDYSHCIVDSIEDITHSLCTLEFESRRASYFWLLEVLGLYKPVVWEYSRLNISHMVMSKRKLNQLCTNGHVNGWDDPRMLTLAGLRRRGASPRAINNFCREIGITRNENLMPMHKLEHHIRADMDIHAPRALAVLRPLRVVITNMPEDYTNTANASRFPGRPEDTTYTVPVTRVVYVEATDFRLTDEKDYFGLAPGKSVMLRYAVIITYVSHTTDASGRVTEVQVTYSEPVAGVKPPKGVLNWVAQPRPGVEPLAIEVRLYDQLFRNENPATLDKWLEDMNPDSLVVLKGCYGCPALAEAKVGDSFQFERLGYFALDPDSAAAGMPVFNRTVTLRESIPKALNKKK